MSIQQCVLTITHADNEVIAILNGDVVYSRKTEGDPALNEQVDLTPLLLPGINHLTIIGVNWGGPANYSGTLQINASTISWGQSQPNPGQGMTWNRSFRLSN